MSGHGGAAGADAGDEDYYAILGVDPPADSSGGALDAKGALAGLQEARP